LRLFSFGGYGLALAALALVVLALSSAPEICTLDIKDISRISEVKKNGYQEEIDEISIIRQISRQN